MERLLRTQLAAGRAEELPPETSDCLDAELLAAWSDRSLPAAELQRLDAHVSTCVRCQSLLATFAHTQPVVHGGVPFWRRWTTQWLVPIAAVGAAGIAIVIWSSTRQRAVAPASAPASQMAHAAPAPPEVIVPPVPPTVVPDAALRQANKSLQSAAKGTAESLKKPGAAPPPPPPAAQPALPLPQPQAPPTNIMIDGVVAAETKVASAVIAEFTAGAALAMDAVTTTAASDRVAAGGGAGAGGGGGGRTVAAGGRGGGGGRGGNAAGAAAPVQNAGVRWRIHLDSSVEKSATGGVTWDRVTFDPPNPAVTSGVAPSAEVCWLIGRKGLVLRTTDGAKFTPVTFPEAVDLRSIVATDGLHATVTTVDGRTFRTENGGLSWQGGH